MKRQKVTVSKSRQSCFKSRLIFWKAKLSVIVKNKIKILNSITYLDSKILRLYLKIQRRKIFFIGKIALKFVTDTFYVSCFAIYLFTAKIGDLLSQVLSLLSREDFIIERKSNKVSC